MRGAARAWLGVAVVATLSDAGAFRCFEEELEPLENCSPKAGRTITLEEDNWDTHRLLTRALRFVRPAPPPAPALAPAAARLRLTAGWIRALQLLEEKLGLAAQVDIHPSVGGPGVYARTGSGLADVNLEVWPKGKEAEARTWMCSSARTSNCTKTANLGATGTSGIFAAAHDRSLLDEADYDYWRSYRTDGPSASTVLDMIPPANFRQDVASVCTEDFCSSDGRFYPAACGGDGQGGGTAGTLATAASAGCRLYLGGDPAWDSGIFEEALDGLGYSLAVSYAR